MFELGMFQTKKDNMIAYLYDYFIFSKETLYINTILLLPVSSHQNQIV